MQTTQHIIASLAVLTFGLALPATSHAQDASTSASSGPVYEHGGLAGTGLVVGLKGGVGFGQVYNSTGTGGIGELELGWVTPYRPLQIFATGSYVRTGRTDEMDPDARLPGAFSYDLVQDQLVVTLGALYRIPLQSDLVRPYAGLGGRAYMTSTEITGYAGPETFGTYTEEGTDFGFYASAGADFFVGPGSILFELQTGYAPVNRFVLQETSTGMLNVAVGYRLFL
jgi:hypothetical protein